MPATDAVKPDRILHELSELWTTMSKPDHGDTAGGDGVLRACAMTLTTFVDEEEDAMSLSGGCFCGRVCYRIGAPLSSGRSCHRSRCRKAFSGSGSAYAEVTPRSFSWVSGEENSHRAPPKAAPGIWSHVGTCMVPSKIKVTNHDKLNRIAMLFRSRSCKLAPVRSPVGASCRGAA